MEMLQLWYDGHIIMSWVKISIGIAQLCMLPATIFLFPFGIIFGIANFTLLLI